MRRRPLADAVLVATVFGLADAALIQWTSISAAAPALIAVAAVTSTALLLPAAALGRLAARMTDETTPGIVVSLLPVLVVVHALRLRAERPPASFLAIVLLGLAVWLLACGLTRRLAWPRALVVATAVAAATTALVWLAALPWRSPRSQELWLASRDLVVGSPRRTALLFGAMVLLSIGAAHTGRPRGWSVALSAALLAVSLPFVPGPGGPTEPGGTPPAAGSRRGGHAGRPDLLVIVLDTVRWDHVTPYRPELPTTPFLARLAAEATLYEHAYTPAPWSLPAHASLLTGLLPHQHGADRQLVVSGAEDEALVARPRPLRLEFETLPEALGEHGYSTALIAANHAFLSPAFGLTRGFQHVDSRARILANVEPLIAPVARRLPRPLAVRYGHIARSARDASSIVDHALEWLDGLPGDRPFFLLLNFMDAHPPTWGELHAAEYPELVPDGEGEPSSEVRYDLALRHLDGQIERLWQGLTRRGLPDDLLVVVTSDHGETFRGGGAPGHGVSLLQSEVRVPLIVRRRPGGGRAEVVRIPASLVDIAPTLLAAAGIDRRPSPPAQALPAPPRPVLLQNSPWQLGNAAAGPPDGLPYSSSWGLIEDGWKLIIHDPGGSELYDLTSDPREIHDLAGSRPERADRLERRLRALLPPRAFEVPVDADGDSLDRETLERLRTLGYIG